MNETLEEMARTLFKSWFVDFDPVRAKLDGRQPAGMDAETAALFPAEFQDSELGKIPKGWEVKSLGDLVTVSSGKRPGKRNKVRDSSFNFELFGAGGVMGFVQEPYDTPPFLLTGRVGTLGEVFRITAPCWPSDNTIILKPNNNSLFDFCTFTLASVNLKKLNRGSTQPLLTQTDVKKISVVEATKELMSVFQAKADKIYRIIENNVEQRKLLASLRDTLLPKLLSGELRIKDAEKFVENAL